ncbi:Transcriptional regulatory protein DegU [Acaryochloris thomasi RCC1774]|uniref:Transcriptional regulatory protein DegU n=1 Tax=Acaryochloris thomasi RCC1774 TaxID=1764569 RepID=A0A2W1JXK0_9CYAN|nr:response regulator transcription factor [Acaryochloris thomasi]PZD74314.1 Transcriptional regulatory protein DegU [Acaryochloris thomasi RCC1774]
MIRLLLVDDQGIVREGLRSLLDAKPDLEVIGEAENGQQAVEQAIALQPDVILMDVRMPIMDGVAATRTLHEQAPHLKVLILTTFDEDDYVTRAMRQGAKGYLLKDTPSNELAEAIRAVQKGYTHLGPGLFDKVMTATPAAPPPPPEINELTPRELEVLQLIAAGKSNREIADALYISERTVKNHVNSILKRLNLRDRTQAAILATNLQSLKTE